MEYLLLALVATNIVILLIFISKSGNKKQETKHEVEYEVKQDLILQKLNFVDEKINLLESNFYNNLEKQIQNSNFNSDKLLKNLYSSQENSIELFKSFEVNILEKFYQETIKNTEFSSNQKIELLTLMSQKLNESRENFTHLSTELINNIEKKINNEIEINYKNKEEILTEVKQSLIKNQIESSNLNEKFLQKIDNSFRQTNELVNKTVSELKAEIAKVVEKQENLSTLESTIKDFNNILSNSKLRGLFGEQTLELILTNYFGEEGDLWHRQYRLQNGLIPDCVVNCHDVIGLLPIDAKFPLDNYRKMMLPEIDNIMRLEHQKQFKNDLKNRLKEVIKYTQQNELTTQAIMFIPAESIFIEICANFPEIIELGYKNNVWIAGPTTLMATLSTVKISVEKVRLNENAEKILHSLDALSIEFDRYHKRNQELEKFLEKFNAEYKKVLITSNKISREFENIKSLKD